MSRGPGVLIASGRLLCVCVQAGVAVAASLFVLLPQAQACGPFIPSTIIEENREALLISPPGFLAEELADILHGVKESGLRAVYPEHPELAAFSELAACMPGGSRKSAEQLLEAWRANCAAQTEAGLAPVFDEAPAEFRLYLQGALAWKRGVSEQACDSWKALLALPEVQRRHRSVWAAYMLGRDALLRLEGLREEQRVACAVHAACDEDNRGDFRLQPAAPSEQELSLVALANTWFERARREARQGGSDVLGLAVESVGWEARVAYLTTNYSKALALYLEQHQAGDPTAFQSLRLTAARALHSNAAVLRGLASDTCSRRLLTAYLVSLPTESTYDSEPGDGATGRLLQAWLDALQGLGTSSIPDADRLAWFCYDGGAFEASAAWLTYAKEDSPVTWWLRGKLSLRDGAREAARDAYLTALSLGGLPAQQRRRLQAELGRVQLSLDAFWPAFEAWMQAEDWDAVAYLAERVLPLPELQSWYDTRGEDAGIPEALRGLVRDLLGRRLARASDPLASKYLEASSAVLFQRYQRHMAEAYDARRGYAGRARSFMAAARIMRHSGMELFGTVIEPDWALFGGSYSLEPRRYRLPVYSALADPYAYYWLSADQDPFAPSAKEVEMLGAILLPEQGKRFHYRYRAAGLAFLAASLLPNDSDETAAYLCEAGGWLKFRDPLAAEPFYKALVVRCAQTALGRQAAERHWFPDSEEGAEALAQPQSRAAEIGREQASVLVWFWVAFVTLCPGLYWAGKLLRRHTSNT